MENNPQSLEVQDSNALAEENDIVELVEFPADAVYFDGWKNTQED